MLINALRGHLSEFGIVAARGPGGLGELVAGLADAPEDELPLVAREALREVVSALEGLEARIRRLDKDIATANKASDAARRLLTVPAVGPIGASAFANLVGDPGQFGSGRDFAAWLGLTPRENSTAGKQRLGRISKQGDRYLRRLLVLGATAVLRRPDCAGPALAAWIRALLARKPARLVSVALANKIARIVWAVLVRGGIYRPAAA